MRAILGTMLDGDLSNLAVKSAAGPCGPTYLVGLTFEDLPDTCCIIGGTGTGKTVTQLRLVSTFMRLSEANPGEPPIRILFVDAKGLATIIASSSVNSRGLAATATFGTGPKNHCAVRRTAAQLRERLSGLFHGARVPFTTPKR